MDRNSKSQSRKTKHNLVFTNNVKISHVYTMYPESWHRKVKNIKSRPQLGNLRAWIPDMNHWIGRISWHLALISEYFGGAFDYEWVEDELPVFLFRRIHALQP